MEISILVPARAGSTRLKNKNNLQLGSCSLVNISCIQGRKMFPGAKAYVSTNDPETMKNCIGEIIKRPDYLCTAESPTITAIHHALQFIKTEWICLLQPDHPFRDVVGLRKQLDAINLTSVDSVFTVAPFHGFLYDPQGEREETRYKGCRPRSQDMPERYVETGEFYLFRRSVLDQADFIFGRKKMIVGVNLMDIHTPDDYEIAKKLWRDSWLW